MDKPVVSFIVPVFNGEDDIERCLLSIKSLKVPADAYEVLIMDNGSTDRTHHILRDLGFHFQVVPKVHVSVLRNRGAALAQGDYLAFVDSDVELSPDWLQNGLATFGNLQVVASGCFPSVPKEATWVQRTWDLHRRVRQSKAKPIPVSWLGTANLIVRRDDFLSVGGFNEYLETTEDVDLCYRLGQRGIILCNPAMDAIHWGEDPNLQTFWRKEAWRGRGSLKGVLWHGLRWDELPSLGYPLYVMCCLLFAIIGVFVDLWHGWVMLAPLSLSLLVLPALLLALNTARLTNQLAPIPQLFLLYLVYGFARAYALMKT